MPHKDRTTGLIVFGGLTILLGCAAGLLGLFMFFGQSIVPIDQRMPIGSLVPAVGMYVVLGVALIVLGIGSIMARRWARALLLIFSWAWLAMGVVETVAMAVLMPMILANIPAATANPGHTGPPPAVFMGIFMLIMFGILGFFFILLPGIWTFFYCSPHVKATCEARDPNPGWTDRCPLPVLAVSLWMWVCVPWMLVVPFTGTWVMPLFGMLLTGFPAGVSCFVIAAIMGVGGWLAYRVDIRGWWLIVVFMLLGCISGAVTFSTHNMIEMYQLMHYPQAQIDQIQKLGFFNGHAVIWIMLLAMLPLFGYLLFIRRYFVAR